VFSSKVEAAEVKIEDGTYIIRSALDRNYVIEVAGQNKNDGVNVQLFKYNGGLNQKFDVKYTKDGYYEIKSANSGKMLDVQGGEKAKGTNVQQWSRANTDSQRWIIQDAGNGYYNLISKCNGLYVDIHEGWVRNSANIQMWVGTRTYNGQRFVFEKVQNEQKPVAKKTIEDGTYQIVSAINNNYVLDVTNNSKADGANVRIWTNNSSDGQKFNVKYIQDGYYEIKSANSGKMLDVQGGEKYKGTNVQQWTSAGTDSQRWIIQDAGNGYYNLISKCNNLYLDLDEGWVRNGGNIQVWEGVKNYNGQQFGFKKVKEPENPVVKKTIEDGTYKIVSAIDNSYVLDVANSSKADGGNVHIWKNNNSASQNFNIKHIGNGYYEIKLVHSGKMLDVQGGEKYKGTNVQQWTSAGTDSQKWIIQDAGNGYYNIISKCNNLYLDIHEGWVRNGGNIQVWEGTKNYNGQKFKFVKSKEPEKPKDPEIPTGKKTIEDGIYQIKSALDEKYVLEVAGSSKANDGNIQIWQNSNSLNQKFDLKYIKDGYYEIRSVNSEKLVEVRAGSKAKGANVQQCENTNSDAQRWIIQDAGNGYYNIICRCNGLYLDVHEGWVRNGGNIQVWEGTKNYNGQKFKFVKTKVLPEKTYKISIKKDSSKVLDISEGAWYNNANVQIWSEASVKQQMYTIKYVDNIYFKITALHSNRSLTVLDNDNVCQSDIGDDNQLWSLSLANNGTYYIKSKKNGKYLTVEGNSNKDGANIKVAAKANNESQMFKFNNITAGKKSTYGKSGKGQDLHYYKYGTGENVFFATFAVHGFEDNWNYDGQELVNIANNFYNKLVSDKNEYIAKNWTIYIMPCVNPDGLSYGWTNYGPGRTTLYSKAPEHKGIDINRSWEIPGVQYKKYTDNRNYNGTAGFQANEASALRDFLLKNKSVNGQTVLIDLHGWENSFIGDEEIGSKYFEANFPSATKKYNKYGEQYLISWAHSVLGARSALVELPDWIKSHEQAVKENLSGKYINSVMNMLKNISLNSPVRMMATRKVGSAKIEITSDEQFNIALAGVMKNGLPEESEIDALNIQVQKNNGVWIDENSKNSVLELINSLTNSRYEVINGYLKVANESGKDNKYDEFIKGLISSNKQYVLSRMGNLYYRDSVSYDITSTDYEDFDEYQTYDYVQDDNRMLIDINTNKKELLTNEEIMDSIIKLIEN